ncbi:hypothetical protein FEM48_Zijuj09G0231800 [Ziziphus jujuba var. spinosa]|uniref:Uncharacterized protein n=1 Tax=Ziziphus jujuba var. spinosa TaxID=714518 RepID=A0A978UVV7_ZIZJJ|nr:hypothetical protein FEM48_Zijuj09G0231800 [Ziziphus jujuba var. spinosa]
MAAESGMNYVLGQSSNANSENLSANPVGLSVSSLESLNFNVAGLNSQHNRSIDNSIRHVKFPSNIGFHFANNNQSYSPNSQHLVQDTRGNRGYNGGYHNRGRGHFDRGRGNRPICQVCGLMGHVGAICYYRYSQPFQQHSSVLQGPNPSVQGQFGYGSQMLAGNFGSSISTQVVSPVPSMYSNALVSPGYSNALVPPGNFMPSGFHQPSAQPNNMVG